jgi:hypothetical protein
MGAPFQQDLDGGTWMRCRQKSRYSPSGIEKRLSQGTVAETRGGFAGHAAPANVLLKRRHAASDNKTNIPVPIFPISRFCSKKGAATAASMHDRVAWSRNLPISFELTTAHPTKDFRLPHTIVSIRHERKPEKLE